MYTDFAYVYDKLMHDVDYGKWADYIEAIFAANGLKPSLVLDLGCGTGSFCMEMTGRGYEMIGIDGSADMLSCAKTKAVNGGLDILYLNQDIADFELYGTVDAIVCLMDTVNYITHKKDVSRLFKLVKNYLNPGGLFIFDINSDYKLEHILGNNIFYEVNDEVTYIWANSYDRRTKICEFDLTFFAREGDTYRRYDEVHFERAFSRAEIKEMVASTGMDVLNMYNELSFSTPSQKSKRIFFVCRK